MGLFVVRQTMPPAKGIHVQDEPMSREALSSVDYVEGLEGISLITSATTATPSNRRQFCYSVTL